MIWPVVYLPRCRGAVLHDMTRETAEGIGRAVAAFARGEVGPGVEQVTPILFCIHAPGGFAMVDVNEEDQTLYVRRLVADEPLVRKVALLDDPPPPDSSE